MDVEKCQLPILGSLPPLECPVPRGLTYIPISCPTTCLQGDRLGEMRQNLAHSRQGRVPTPTPWPRSAFRAGREGLGLQERAGATVCKDCSGEEGRPVSKEHAKCGTWGQRGTIY